MKYAERRYPTACTSVYCGAVKADDACKLCPNRPELDAFEQWVREHDAYCPDDIWAPLRYVARR